MTSSTNDASIVTQSRWAIDPQSAARMDTEALRANFLVEDLFVAGKISLTYTHYDRLVVGGACPAEAPLSLQPIDVLAAAHFLDRRELVAVNVGGPGAVEADGTRFALGSRDMIYIGMGTRSVTFSSDDSARPAKFYIVSAPAHATHPTRAIRIAEAQRLDRGSAETANQRSIFQFVHAGGVKSCQLVVGMTTFEPGSVWNTMPAHVHDRRSEAYLYFDLADDQRVVHLMGEPSETRHLIVANEQAILSPGWSIHAGAGTGRYTFVWAMAGENIDYGDVDSVAIEDLR